MADIQAYWPFHKAACFRNEFADQIERQEPKFARWMRGHRKLAVLKDDEVDRLERASKPAVGDSREARQRTSAGQVPPEANPPRMEGRRMVPMESPPVPQQRSNSPLQAVGWPDSAVGPLKSPSVT